MMRGFAVLILVYVSLVSDLKEGVVSNTLTLPAVLTGLFLSLFEGGVEGFRSSLNAVFCSFIISVLLFRLGFIGGGDGKLLIAGSSLCGFPDCFKIFFLAFLAGAMHVVFDALFEGKWVKGKVFPFSPCIGIGILCTWGLR
mgnify:CR=1 FL=1